VDDPPYRHWTAVGAAVRVAAAITVRAPATQIRFTAVDPTEWKSRLAGDAVLVAVSVVPVVGVAVRDVVAAVGMGCAAVCLRLSRHRSIVTICCRPPHCCSSRSGLRSTQLIQGDAQRRAGDFDQPAIRLIRFEHHKDRAGKRKRGNEQCCHHAGIARCVEPETGEDNR
jgi:hypothetical protein